MVGAIGGGIGMFGDLGIGGAAAVGGGIGAGGPAAAILGGPAPPSFTVSISEAGSAALAADAGKMTVFGINDGSGLTLAVGGAANLAAMTSAVTVNGLAPGVTVSVDFPNLDINAQLQNLIGANQLDELIAALLLALLSQQDKQGSA